MAAERTRLARIERKLREALDPVELRVIDDSHLHAGHAGAASGGGHFRVRIASHRFRGLSLVERQRLVYRVLGDEMGGEIHALSMEAIVPEP